MNTFTTASEIIVIDPKVINYETLIAGLNPDIPVVFLPTSGDGLQLLANALISYTHLSTLHLVSYGDEQALLLGSHLVNNTDLANHQHTLTAIATHFEPHADVLLYGCSVASTNSGHSVVDNLATALGIDVSTATNGTDVIALGGDWDFSATAGDNDSILPYSVADRIPAKQALVLSTTFITTSTTFITTSTTFSTTYTTTTTDDDDYEDDTSTSGIINVGGAATGVIETANDNDWFRVSLIANHSYNFELKGIATNDGSLNDPWLLLKNASGDTTLAGDNDSGTGLNALIADYIAPSSGTYYLSAWEWSEFGTGSYTLTANDTTTITNDDYADNDSTSAIIKVGGIATGTIDISNDNDWFRISLIAGHQYNFELKGADTFDGTLTDPYLELRNAGNGYLIGDNDLGEGSNALIAGFTASITGTYYLSAWAWTNGTGSYTLTAKDLTQPSNHLPTGQVLISNTAPQQGQTLTASNTLADQEGLGQINYTWKTGSTILGTGNNYVLNQTDVNKAILVTATYTDGLGRAESVNSAVTAKVMNINDAPTGSVTINNNAPQQGQTLTVSNTLADLDGLGTLSYLWKTDSVVLGTGNSYLINPADANKAIFVTASYTDGFGTVESVSSANTNPVKGLNHRPTGSVSINDTTPQQGQILTASSSLVDTDGLGTISYTWKSGTTLLGTGKSYTVTANEVGKAINVTASYTDGLGTIESVSSTATSIVTAALKAGVTFQLQSTDSNTSEGNALVDNTAGTIVLYGVTLNTAPVANHSVTLNFSSSDITEGIVTPSLTFTSANWNQTQLLKISGVDDLLNDGNVSYTITPLVDENLTDTLEYLTISIPTFSLQNLDDVEDVPINDDTSGNIGTTGVDYMQGNNGADQLYGNYGYDELKGGYGNDELYGEQGNDRLYGQMGNDTLYGGVQNDKLFGDEGNDTLWGDEGLDSLSGGDGNDVLDGGTGLDTLVGGAGNDTYYLGYDAVDVIDDKGLSTDIDTVIMPYQLTSYTLPAGIEKGTMTTGNQPNSLTGNTSNNVLTGNEGKNTLSGAVGRDSLFGGTGDDVLNGGADDDVLEGGVGKDNLTGGAGKDSFVFNAVLKSNVDKITDFKPIDDTFKLENKIFTKLTATGVLNANLFFNGTAAHDPNDYVIYNPTTGVVTYDSDGSGIGQGVQIAVLGLNLSLTNTDFVVI